MTTAKGFAVSTGAPLVAVHTLDAAAFPFVGAWRAGMLATAGGEGGGGCGVVSDERRGNGEGDRRPGDDC